MVNSFKYAGEGIVWALKNHQNLRVFIVIGLLVLFIASIVGVTRNEYLILFLTIVIALIAEMLNTALEEMTNLITIKWSHQAKVVKDIGAGMSLCAALSAVVVGVLIFVPYLAIYLQ